MPLHRDIHWIGRQWAVTGHGMQLIDQKLQGFFDIEIDRLWDDALIESVHAKAWLNTADFDKGLALARARYPQPSGAALQAPAIATPPVEPPTTAAPPRQAVPLPAIEPAAPLPPAVKPSGPKPESARLETAKPAAPAPIKPVLSEPPRAAPELKAPAIATRAAVATPIAVTQPWQAAPAPAIEPAAPPPPAVQPTEQKPKVFKLEAPEPVTVTLLKRRPAEPTAAVAVPAAAPPSFSPAAKPEEPKQPSLLQMRYECHARFVRPWRVVTKRPT